MEEAKRFFGLPKEKLLEYVTEYIDFVYSKHPRSFSLPISASVSEIAHMELKVDGLANELLE